jgi:hypothetical protein
MVYQNKFVASVKVGGRILRERDAENVYLPFGSEYSILLKNLEGRRASVSIEIDGTDVLDGHTLILYPNQTMELERFILNGNLSTGPRFKFIEKTEQISEHRGDKIDDGIVRISYQFEEHSFNIRKKSILPTYGDHTYHTYGGHSRGMFDSEPTRGMTYNSNQSNVVGQSSNIVTDSLSDDGITVKGSDSGQQFQYGHIGTLESTIHTICIKLHGTHDKGVVHAPITIQSKKKCEVCGTTNTSRNKFCGSCGNNLNW